MSKSQWESTLKWLEKKYSEFSLEYSKSKNSKTKGERTNAASNVRITIEQTKKFVRQNEEIFEILSDGATSDYERAIIMDEFSSPRYFDKDMNSLISEMRRKIQ